MIRLLLPILSLAGCNAALRVKVAGSQALPIPETPPAVTLQLTNAEAVMSDADLTVAWTVDGWDASALKYDVSLASTAACTDSVATLGVTGATQTTFANIWEGTHYLCVKTQVGEKTFEASNNGVKVVVDRAAPTTSGLSLSLVNRTTNLVEVSWPKPTAPQTSSRFTATPSFIFVLCPQTVAPTVGEKTATVRSVPARAAASCTLPPKCKADTASWSSERAMPTPAG